jgi:hypothetical protein
METSNLYRLNHFMNQYGINMDSLTKLFNLKLNQITTTENGAKAYETTGEYNLDLFTNIIRGINDKLLLEFIQKAWIENPKTFLKIMRHTRDCRTGKGERDVFYRMALWLRENDFETYILNIGTMVSEDGYFKDLINIAKYLREKNIEYKYELRLLAQFLVEDILKFKKNNKDISLCAKWCPTFNDSLDKKYNFTKQFVTILFTDLNFNEEWIIKRYQILNLYKNRYMESYRKEILKPLRKHLNIVENLMSSRNFNNILFQSVPAKAMLNYRKAFIKQVPNKYNEYLSNLIKGEVKVNISGLMPHELVSKVYIENDILIEQQFKELVKKYKDSGTLQRTLSIVDVSGSMSGIPMKVAIAMGLFTSLIPDENDQFYKKIITFSENPQFHKVKGETLHQMVNNIKHIEWGMSTNIEKVFRLILDSGKMFNLTQEQMPLKIIIYTDMEFNQATRNDTNYEIIKQLYEENGYQLPKIIFWNLRASSKAFPIKGSTPNTALLSGYSAELLKGIMEDIINPIQIMNKILEKYIVFINNSDI